MNTIKPEDLAQFEVGKIMVCSWGHEQTNVDFFKIVKVTNTKPDVIWITLQAIEEIQTHNAEQMTGTTIPNPDKHKDEPPFRRRVFVREGVTNGCKIKDYTYAYPWDGKPEHYSTYG